MCQKPTKKCFAKERGMLVLPSTSMHRLLTGSPTLLRAGKTTLSATHISSGTFFLSRVRSVYKIKNWQTVWNSFELKLSRYRACCSIVEFKFVKRKSIVTFCPLQQMES